MHVRVAGSSQVCYGKLESVANEISFGHVWLETNVEQPTGAIQWAAGNLRGRMAEAEAAGLLVTAEASKGEQSWKEKQKPSPGGGVIRWAGGRAGPGRETEDRSYDPSRQRKMLPTLERYGLA